jgi:hypothetical protein
MAAHDRLYRECFGARLLHDVVDAKVRRLEQTLRDSERAQEEGRSSAHIEAERTALERERGERIELQTRLREAEAHEQVVIGAVIDYLIAVGIRKPDEVFLALRAVLDAAED